MSPIFDFNFICDIFSSQIKRYQNNFEDLSIFSWILKHRDFVEANFLIPPINKPSSGSCEGLKNKQTEKQTTYMYIENHLCP